LLKKAEILIELVVQWAKLMKIGIVDPTGRNLYLRLVFNWAQQNTMSATTQKGGKLYCACHSMGAAEKIRLL